MRILFFAVAVQMFIPTALFGQAKETHNATWYFNLGENALDRREYLTAQAHFTECLRLDPAFANAYRLRAITREHLNDMSRALVDYNIYVDLMPDDPEALFNRAVLRFETGQILPARQDFQKLLKMPQQETNTVYFSQEKYSDAGGKVFTYANGGKDYIYNYLGLIETKIKRYDIAIMWLDSALRISPENPGYLINRGIARLEKKDMQGAKIDFELALKSDPDNALAMHNIAILKSFDAQNESEKLLTEAIEKNKNLPYPRAERAFYRLQNNNLSGALQDYNEVVRMEPNVADGYLNRGFVKERLKDLEGALQDFSKAITLDDKNPKAWLGRGNVMSKVGKWKEAAEDYTVAIEIDPGYNLAYYNRAMALSNNKRMEEACSDLKAAEKRGMEIKPQVKAKICR
jgi:tetratricopeptide (TPR) repeat protein